MHNTDGHPDGDDLGHPPSSGRPWISRPEGFFPKRALAEDMSIGDRIDSKIDRAKGKANEIAGEARGDEDQRLRGKGQRLRGDARDVVTDVKDTLKGD